LRDMPESLLGIAQVCNVDDLLNHAQER